MRIFLSYHTPDSRIAESLKTAVEAKMPGWEVFVAHRDLKSGAPWQPQLSAGIANSDAFVILLGSKIGRWQLPEYYAAHNRMVAEEQFRLVPVLTAEDAPALPFLSSIQYLQVKNPAIEPALSQIVAALKGERQGSSEHLWMNVNPYRGLESLREEDADFFFGREEETATALNLLASPVNSIVTLIGNSGVGKSSLVEAGVFAALRREALPHGGVWPSGLRDSADWAAITMRPGEDPIQALVSGFMDLWFGDMTDPERIRRRNMWAALFRDGEAPLRDIIQATVDRFEKELALPAPRRILLNINQAEELYSLAPEPARIVFSRLLAQALTDRRIAVIASLRADYYGYHQANAPLFDHMARVDVRPFSEEGLKRVIDGPAAVLGASFESGELADFIVRGAAGQAGALPLLAFYMTDLWERMQKRGDGVLRLADKAEMIDVGRALTNQADRFLAEHPTQIDAVKRLFTLKLALVQEEGKAVRRRVPRARLDDAEWALIEALCEPRWRLVTVGEDDAGGAYAEVAHEIFLQSWGTLVAWLESEREFLAFKARAERDRARWEREKRAQPALLSGLDLIQAEQWLAMRSRDFDAEDAEYIRKSVRVRDAQMASDLRFRRWVMRGSIAAAVVMTTVCGIAVVKRDEAERQRSRAEQAVHLAEEAEIRTKKTSADSMAILGAAYIDAKRIPHDPKAGLSLIQRALDAGSVDAIYMLGTLYFYGEVVPQDYRKARDCFVDVAKKGNSQGLVALGLMYDRGLGVPKDFEKAYRLWLAAAQLENSYAMNNLGGMEEKGERGAVNFDTAKSWYENALKSNEPSVKARVKSNMGTLLELGSDNQVNYDSAYSLYLEAAKIGDGRAMYNLAYLIERHLSPPSNEKDDGYWYKKGINQGETDTDGVVMSMLAEKFFKKHDYAQALSLQNKITDIIEQAEIEGKGKASRETAIQYELRSKYAIFGKDFAFALESAKKSLAFYYRQTSVLLQAHASMLLGKNDEARSIYFKYAGFKVADRENKNWESLVLADFAEFEEAGFTLPPLAAEIRAAFAPATPPN